MEEDNNKYIRFDWAVKRILRDKANFGVLEGLITVLLEEPVHIVEILESEGNQEESTDKYNRVDIKAKNSKDEIIIVEVQLTRELYYLQRILYGVSKAITEHINLGDKYDQVKKVYSISILYFDLGQGADYLYHGYTQFVGVHTHDNLKISTRDRKIIEMQAPEKIFPEYYLIRVNQFNEVAKTPLEEWIDYLKNGHIKDNTTAPGLQEAKQKLQQYHGAKRCIGYREDGRHGGRKSRRKRGRKKGRESRRKSRRKRGRKSRRKSRGKSGRETLISQSHESGRLTYCNNCPNIRAPGRRDREVIISRDRRQNRSAQPYNMVAA